MLEVHFAEVLANPAWLSRVKRHAKSGSFGSAVSLAVHRDRSYAAAAARAAKSLFAIG
jgi:hypothetical protein